MRPLSYTAPRGTAAQRIVIRIALEERDYRERATHSQVKIHNPPRHQKEAENTAVEEYTPDYSYLLD